MRSRDKSGKATARSARLARQATAINSEIEGLLEAAEAVESEKLKKLNSIRDRKARVAALDDSLLLELRWLIEKYFSPRTPQNLESILLELLRMLSKIIWKLFVLQGLRPPRIDPRLLQAGGAIRSRKG